MRINLLSWWAEGALPCSIWLQSHSGKGSDFYCPASNNVSSSKKKKKTASNNQQQAIHDRDAAFKHSISFTDRCQIKGETAGAVLLHSSKWTLGDFGVINHTALCTIIFKIPTEPMSLGKMMFMVPVQFWRSVDSMPAQFTLFLFP